jgi:hypothetical protein
MSLLYQYDTMPPTESGVRFRLGLSLSSKRPRETLM